MNAKQELGALVKKARLQKKYTLMAVARYLNLATESTIHQFESGQRNIPCKYLAEIADLLDMNLEEMIVLKVQIEKEKIISEVYGKGCSQ